MKFIADLHIHSPYSRATSAKLTLENVRAWGITKGLGVIGTGDCTHPVWLANLRDECIEDGSGLLALKHPFAENEYAPLPLGAAGSNVKFMITGEISTVYKYDGAVRKVHHCVCLPSLDAADRFAQKLSKIGNIRSDGRPILGIDSRDLLEILLESAPDAWLFPAHIWTPWFSALGARSGFNSISACYRDLANHIFAVETGLSSDPAMNWRVSSLDKYTLISNSDAHSAANLGREANLFDCDQSFAGIAQALNNPAQGGMLGTLEFFPEEGKYHWDGHRACNIVLSPQESRHFKGICPVCGKPLTQGVDCRVEELADRKPGTKPAFALPFTRLLSLDSILSEILGTGVSSKRVLGEYNRLISELGPELAILRDMDLALVRQKGGDLVSEAIHRLREGRVITKPGYDGEYGNIRVFVENEIQKNNR